MEAVLRIIDYVLRLAFDEDAGVLVFSDVECLGRVSVLKQVVQLLVVNLQERTVHSETLIRVFVLDHL